LCECVETETDLGRGQGVTEGSGSKVSVPFGKATVINTCVQVIV